MLKKILFLALLGAISLAFSRAEPGSDHPMVSRYDGSVMDQYKYSEYDEGIVPLGKLKRNKTNEFDKHVDFEGKITFIRYKNPKDRSTLEIMKNYEQALKSQGFQIVWQCKNEAQCGTGTIQPTPNFGPHDGKFFFINNKPVRSVTGKLTRSGKSAYVYVAIVSPKTYLYIFEAKDMDTGMVSADSLAVEMAKNGKAVLHINFDSGKAIILPDSIPTIEQIVKLMKKYPDMKASIEGHTDSDGSDSANKSLSEARAKAVKTALTEGGIKASRMESKGYGESKPVADNGTDEGKAENRRVEIVNLTPDVLKNVDTSKVTKSSASSSSNGEKSRIQKKLEDKQEEATDEIIDKSVDEAVDKAVDTIFKSIF